MTVVHCADAVQLTRPPMPERFATAALRLEPGTPVSFALDRAGAPIWSRLTPVGATAPRERGSLDAVGQAVRDSVEVAAGCRIGWVGVVGAERVTVLAGGEELTLDEPRGRAAWPAPVPASAGPGPRSVLRPSAVMRFNVEDSAAVVLQGLTPHGLPVVPGAVLAKFDRNEAIWLPTPDAGAVVKAFVDRMAAAARVERLGQEGGAWSVPWWSRTPWIIAGEGALILASSPELAAEVARGVGAPWWPGGMPSAPGGYLRTDLGADCTITVDTERHMRCLGSASGLAALVRAAVSGRLPPVDPFGPPADLAIEAP